MATYRDSLIISVVDPWHFGTDSDSVVDPECFFSDPDPTFRRVSDPIPDPDPTPDPDPV
jgi:hypothetical protein